MDNITSLRQFAERRTRDESYYWAKASMLEAQLEALIEKDPIGAAKSKIGIASLMRYTWLMREPMAAMGLLCEDILNCPGPEGTCPECLDNKKNCTETLCCRKHCNKWHCEPHDYYKRKFYVEDVVLHAAEITHQLIAEEYFEDGGDLTPYHLESVWHTQNRLTHWDPFSSEFRPDVTVENESTGEKVNLSQLPAQDKPKEGFKELDD